MIPEIVEINSGNKKQVHEYLNFIFQVFPGAKFLEWWERGFWGSSYIPFSIFESGKIISNVTAALMEVIISGEKYKAVQLGAVGTLPEYRNKGLSRILMEYVLQKYGSEAKLFFLFANENVLKFYPRFGFKPVSEKLFLLDSNIPLSNYSARRLDLKNFKDYRFLLDRINERDKLTEVFGAENYGSITMWHIFNSYKNNLFYLEEEDAIFIKTEKKNEMHIRDVIYRKPGKIFKNLSKIIESDSIERIYYYFPPDRQAYPFNKTVEHQSHLFISNNIELKSDMLKFPETGKT